VTDSDASHTSRPLFVSLPIFWQVLGLSLTVLVLALGINTLLVLKAPSPPPSGYTISEAATALKGGEVRLQNGHRLIAQDRDTPPDYVPHPPQTWPGAQDFQNLIRTRLAQELGVSADTIWVNFAPRHDFGYRQNRNHGPFSGPGNGGPDSGGPGNGPAPQQDPGFHDPGPHPGNGHDPGNNSGAGPMGPRATADSRANIFFPAFNAAWKLPDGQYRVITAPRDLIEPWQIRLLLGFGLTALLIVPLAYLLSQRLARPIIAFSEAAAKLSVEDNAPPIMAAGPREVRQAAEVVNALQTHIRQQIESRTMLMGAIAHDLKTPLARMRLRIEDLPTDLRDKLSQDIAHMDALIRSAMSFTSAHKLADQVRPLDASALVESLVEDLGAVCNVANSQIEPNLMINGDQVALTRIVTNLVENANRYAANCRVRLSAHGSQVELSVIDDGPGLPADALEAVFEPFYRLESSRNRDTGGTGLGLSVARALAEAQGGGLSLHNRYEGAKIVGLEARLILPRLQRKRA